MRRVRLDRDAGLEARMVAAAAFLLVLYAALFAALYGLYRIWPDGWPFVLVVAVALGVAVVGHVRSTEQVLLASVGVAVHDENRQPELHRDLTRLAALADVPVPNLAIVDSPVANAFAVGLNQKRATLVVTRGLLERLNPREIDAVLAHELSHVASRDAALMTAATGPRVTGDILLTGEGWGTLAYVLWPLGVPLIVFGGLASLALSRYREFAADRGSALLTGAPEQLMSALQKLADAEGIPEDDLRRFSGVEALCIVANLPPKRALLMDHPPLARRLEALAAVARRLGKVEPRWA